SKAGPTPRCRITKGGTRARSRWRWAGRSWRTSFPRRPELADGFVDRVDETLQHVLIHRRRDGAHATRRHQHTVVDEPQQKVARLLLVGRGHRPVVDHRLLREVNREQRAHAVDLGLHSMRCEYL